MAEPTGQGRGRLDLADFAGQAWAALRDGVVRYGVVIDVPAEGMQSHTQGLLDLSAGRFAQRVRTVIAHLPPEADTDTDTGAEADVDAGADVDAQMESATGVEMDDTTPQYFAGGVLSMPITQDGGSRRWVRLQGCTVADAGVVPLLWASGAADSANTCAANASISGNTNTEMVTAGGADDVHRGDDKASEASPEVDRRAEPLTGGGRDGQVRLNRASVLSSSGDDAALGELVGQSVRTLGWSDPACRPSARFEQLGQWWWARLHLPAARGLDQADLVMTVTFAAAEAGTTVPLAPPDSDGVPVITPEVFTRLLAADWSEDLPFRSLGPAHDWIRRR